MNAIQIIEDSTYKGKSYDDDLKAASFKHPTKKKVDSSSKSSTKKQSSGNETPRKNVVSVNESLRKNTALENEMPRSAKRANSSRRKK